MKCKEKFGSCKDWNTKRIRDFNCSCTLGKNQIKLWYESYICRHYKLAFLGGSEIPQEKKATPDTILSIILVLVQNVSSRLHLYSKHSENFPHFFHLLPLPLSQHIRISPGRKPCVGRKLWSTLKVSTRQLGGKIPESTMKCTCSFSDGPSNCYFVDTMIKTYSYFTSCMNKRVNKVPWKGELHKCEKSNYKEIQRVEQVSLSWFWLG